MKLIVTRPLRDAEALAAKLTALGHEPLLMPLLEIVRRSDVTVPPRAYQAICLTSANGIVSHPALTAIPVVTVGPQSAAAAIAAGFKTVSHHGGDVTGLADYIVETLKPQDGPLLYLSGAMTSGDLEGKLAVRGFPVDRVITYDARATHPQNISEAVRSCDGVLLYSPRSAKLWASAVEAAALQPRMAQFLHLCLSAAVAKALPQSWPTRIAETPDESALLASLEPSGKQE